MHLEVKPCHTGNTDNSNEDVWVDYSELFMDVIRPIKVHSPHLIWNVQVLYPASFKGLALINFMTLSNF